MRIYRHITVIPLVWLAINANYNVFHPRMIKDDYGDVNYANPLNQWKIPPATGLKAGDGSPIGHLFDL